MFQTLHEISKNLIFVFVWKYVWKYVNINVSDIKKKKEKQQSVSIHISAQTALLPESSLASSTEGAGTEDSLGQEWADSGHAAHSL